MGPELAVADGALGFWQAVEEVWPRTCGQRCWVHKTGIVGAFGVARGEAAVAEGARLKLLFADLDGSGAHMTLARLSVYSGETLETNIAINDRGGYVRVTPPRHAKRSSRDDSDDADDADGMRLYNSFYETALKQEIPRPVIDDLVRIFANDVDFQGAATAGNSFEAFYDESEEAGTPRASLCGDHRPQRGFPLLPFPDTG